MDKVAKTFNESMIEKFNPYHDRLGRFSSASGAASMTFRTRSALWQNAANRSIERAKQHHASTMPTAAQAKTLKSIESRTRNLKKEQFRVVDREGNVIMEKKGDENSVAFTIGEARDNFPGNITIHNHPDGGTFSTADLSGIGHGATEIRAAAPEGTYILRNTRYGQKYDGATTKTWYHMREDLESAAMEFKSGIALKTPDRRRLPFRIGKAPAAPVLLHRIVAVGFAAPDTLLLQRAQNERIGRHDSAPPVGPCESVLRSLI